MTTNPYVLEFSSLIVEKFSLDVSPQSLVEIWDTMIGTSTVMFNRSADKRDSEDRLFPCNKVLSSGANKGKRCGKKCVDNSTTCAKHSEKPSEKPSETDTTEVVKVGCVYLLTMGVNKGKECGKKCSVGTMCSVHSKPKVEKLEKPKVDISKTTYKLVVKERDNGLLVAINETPDGSYFVFDNKRDKLICGKITPTGNVIDLDEADIKFCQDNKHKMSVVVSKKVDIEDILDEIQTPTNE